MDGTGGMVAVGVIALIALLLILTHARIIRTRNAVEEALGSVDAQLQKRGDLVPNMVAVAKRHLRHEEALLTHLVELRVRAEAAYDRSNTDAVTRHLAAAAELSGGMQRLVTAFEGYPELRSVEAMIRLMDALEEVEANISAARRYYNQAVAAYRNATQTIPGNLVAPLMSVGGYPFFEATEIAQRPVDVAAALD